MRALVLDTETTGFAKPKKPLLDPAQPKLVQLGAVLGEVFVEDREDDEGPYIQYGKIISRLDAIIYPEVGDFSWTIPAEPAKVHGITTELAQAVGVNLDGVLLVLADLIANADIVVAHNAVYDVHVLKCAYALLEEYAPVAGLEATSQDLFEETPVYCSMIGAKQLPEVTYKGTKGPNLSSLHQQLIGYDFEGAHAAFEDVMATWRCFCVINQRLTEMNGGQDG